MSLEKGGAESLPSSIRVERADIREAFKGMAQAAKSRPDRTMRNGQPDSLLTPNKECTPDKETALRDFEIIESNLTDAGVDVRSERVLEVGSGMGELLAVLRARGIDAVGIDHQPRDLRRSEGAVGIINAPLGALKPERVGQFGVVLAKNVFDNDRYAFQIYREMLSQIDALLKTGGVFLKIGTGAFAPGDIPPNWEKMHGSSGHESELYQKN